MKLLVVHFFHDMQGWGDTICCISIEKLDGYGRGGDRKAIKSEQKKIRYFFFVIKDIFFGFLSHCFSRHIVGSQNYASRILFFLTKMTL